jgi:hypothetical protein
MSKKKSSDELDTNEGESVQNSGSAPDRDPLTVIKSLRERLNRWPQITNHDKIEGDKELDFLETQFS